MMHGSSTVPPRPDAPIPDREQAEGYAAKVCFKTGPPTRIGVELEWTVHHRDDPARPLDAHSLCQALGDYAPPTLRPDSAHLRLARGGLVTVEPGGQVEISSPPFTSLTDLYLDTSVDIAQLAELLADAGLCLGESGADPDRPPRRILDSPRYSAMECAFDRVGPAGRLMMCSTAGLQVCLDAGAAHRVAARWHTLHALGPILIALFANSPRIAMNDTGWASSRMRTWYATDPDRTGPTDTATTPAATWAARVLDTPLLCVRRPSHDWQAPPRTTFAHWLAGDILPRPTFSDLDYHIGTLFPPVRPRGYLEVRYLDTQPVTVTPTNPSGWFAPVATLAALFAEESTVDDAAVIAAPAQEKWVVAAQDGLADPTIAKAAADVVELTRGALPKLGLPSPVADAVSTTLVHRLKQHSDRKG